MPGSGPKTTAHKHLLLYEPRTEGHHPGWLRFLSEDLLSAGYDLTLAVDSGLEAKPILDNHLAGLERRLRRVPAIAPERRATAAEELRWIARLLEETRADSVLMCALDEIASGCWRRAACGLMPPPVLRGRLAGIYHRPRFFDARWSVDRVLKRRGFRRLVTGLWIRPLFILDEFLAGRLQQSYPAAPIRFLPDPCPDGFDADRAAARSRLGLPANKRVFLFYGTGDPRKGLPLAVRAMSGLERTSRSFLFCVGRQNPAGETKDRLLDLEAQGRATTINRYVSLAEERLAFAAADFVLLPYLNHFGTSGVLSRAAAARRPVIASDEQLVGRLTREHGLGLLFRPGSVDALLGRLREAALLADAQMSQWDARLARYAEAHSRPRYRTRLLEAMAATFAHD